MPELPEVETTRRGVLRHLRAKTVRAVVIRERRLRWPITPGLAKQLHAARLQTIDRRAKYLLFRFAHGTLIVHLGMSGSLRVLNKPSPPQKHDHWDIQFAKNQTIRFTDPRRFGCTLWTSKPVKQHRLFQHLGPEPWDADCTAERFHAHARKRQQAIKIFIMDQKVIVGVGNIYASEALFRAGIHPLKAASRVSLHKWRALLQEIRLVLEAAIEQGGTSLRDFSGVDGNQGYFGVRLLVYGHAGDPCPSCHKPLTQKTIGGRNSFYCTQCQT